MPISSFELFLEFGDFGSRTRLVHFCRTLVAKPAGVKESIIGTGTLVGHAIPLLYCPSQVWNSPELTINCGCCWTKQTGGCVISQTLSQVIEFRRCQLGSIPSRMLVNQSFDSTVPISSASFHKTCATTPGYLHHILSWMSRAIELHGLVARACRTIPTSMISCGQLSLLFVGYPKSS